MRIVATTDHADWSPIRQHRNRLLVATDRLMISDFPISTTDREDVAAYRVLLRDLLSAFGHPSQVEWPAMPPAVLAHLPTNDAPTPPQL